MNMTLKLKYRTGLQYKSQKSSSGNAGHKSRHKLSAQQKALLPKQPLKVMRVFPGGRTRMELAA